MPPSPMHYNSKYKQKPEVILLILFFLDLESLIPMNEIRFQTSFQCNFNFNVIKIVFLRVFCREGVISYEVEAWIRLTILGLKYK